MSLRDAFEKQIAEINPCSGDYLENRTYDEVLTGLVQTEVFKNQPDGVVQARSFLDKKIEEWKEHKGQHLFFYLARLGMGVEIRKVWEGDLSELEAKYEWEGAYAHPDSALPDLKEIVK